MVCKFRSKSDFFSQISLLMMAKWLYVNVHIPSTFSALCHTKFGVIQYINVFLCIILNHSNHQLFDLLI